MPNAAIETVADCPVGNALLVKLKVKDPKEEVEDWPVTPITSAGDKEPRDTVADCPVGFTVAFVEI